MLAYVTIQGHYISMLTYAVRYYPGTLNLSDTLWHKTVFLSQKIFDTNSGPILWLEKYQCEGHTEWSGGPHVALGPGPVQCFRHQFLSSLIAMPPREIEVNRNLEVNADTPPLALQSTTVLLYRSNNKPYPLLEKSSKLWSLTNKLWKLL
jgi:hypothetical protein